MQSYVKEIIIPGKKEVEKAIKDHREKEIYKFIESYGAITIKQAFRDNSNYKSAYSSCSRTLIKIQKNNILKSEINKQSGEKMYFITRAKTF